MREFGGRARTYFAIATLNRERIADADLAAAKIDAARASEAWESLRNGVHMVPNLPAGILNDIEAVEARYFGEYVPLTARLQRASQEASQFRLPDYGITFDAFFEVSNGALGAVERLSQDSGVALTEYWNGRRQVALAMAIGSCLFASISLLGLVAIYAMLPVRVISLLGAATRILASLAAGELGVQIRVNRRELHEIGELFTTVQSFRKALEDARKLEAEAEDAAARRKEVEAAEARRERDRLAGEQELANNARIEAERRSERERLEGAEIAAVVESCSAVGGAPSAVAPSEAGVLCPPRGGGAGRTRRRRARSPRRRAVRPTAMSARVTLRTPRSRRQPWPLSPPDQPKRQGREA